MENKRTTNSTLDKSNHKNRKRNADNKSEASLTSSLSPAKKLCNNFSATSSQSNYHNNSDTLSNSKSNYSQNFRNKRKRESSNDDDKDLMQPIHPSKRQQLVSNSTAITLQCSSNSEIDPPSSVEKSSSISSSSYSSPAQSLVNEIDAISSSECLSTAAEYDWVLPSPEDVTLVASIQTSTSSQSFSPNDDLSDDRQIVGGDTTPHSRKLHVTPFIEYSREYRDLTPATRNRPCPLPALSWAKASDVWNLMCRKDEYAAKERCSTMLEQHQTLQPRMRAILLDWLIEVCEVYKLHRETYYLAIDYLDRYLSIQNNVQKTHLQLIGITCLFVAAKIEEIYPPKIIEFAYVTDGACQEEDILQHELLLLSALDWNLTPITIMGWLGMYMQLNVSNRSEALIKNVTNYDKNVNLEKCVQTTNMSNNNYNNSNNNSNNNNSNNNSNNNNNKNSNNNNNDCNINNSNINNSNNKNNNNNISSNNNGNSNVNDTNTNQHNNNNNNNNNNNSNINKILNDNKKIGDDKLTSGRIHKAGRSQKQNAEYCNNNTDVAFIYPQFSGLEFAQTAHLLDLCTMDISINDYSYSVVAAAAISHTFGRETAMRVSGYDWNILQACHKWMEPFFYVIRKESQHFYLMEQNDQFVTKFGLGHICPNIVTDDSHIIQIHATSMTMFDQVQFRLAELKSLPQEMANIESSPAVSTAINHLCPLGLLTPPASGRKTELDEDNV